MLQGLEAAAACFAAIVGGQDIMAPPEDITEQV
jgi:hypothetical protein